MTDFALIVCDTSPLITLSRADELDLLLVPQISIEIPDVVFFEATREAHEDGIRLGAWINARKDMVRIVPTERSAEWLVLRENNMRARGYGELAAIEVAGSFAEANPGKIPILLYEDADVNKLRHLGSEVALVTTGTLLQELEQARLIQSADRILDQAAGAGRNIEQQRDQPRNFELGGALERKRQDDR